MMLDNDIAELLASLTDAELVKLKARFADRLKATDLSQRARDAVQNNFYVLHYEQARRVDSALNTLG